MMIMIQAIKVSREERVEEQRKVIPLRRRVRTQAKVIPVFAYPKNMDYQLIEVPEHKGKYSSHLKERINPRAGP